MTGRVEVDEGLRGYLGDDVRVKENAFRIATLNIGGMTVDNNNEKNDTLRNFINDRKIDVMGLQELNVDWRRVRAEHRLERRIKHMIEGAQAHHTYNRTVNHTHTQTFGGTGLISIGEAAHRIDDRGQDPTGLGRWCWVRYRGKDNLRVKVYSLYRPGKSNMTGSVYQQHMEYFEDKSMATAEPRKTIMDDLKTDLLSSMEDGDQLVVMGDFNEDVRRGYVRQTLTAYNLDLVEINQYSRPHDRMPPTSTTGSDPIDGIFVSRCLSGSRCGYLAFGEGVIHPTHRVLWIDLIKSIAFGNSFTPKRPPPRKLHNRDPRVVERYRNELHDHLVANSAFEKL